MLGNEAIARGAIEAGVQVVAAYPGTPSSEIVEELLKNAPQAGFYAEWSINEKVSFELAAGAALTGARALTAMKGAGLNVVMDLFLTLPYTGTRGGLVIVVADDPDAHYSSNEQDSRLLAQAANLPCLEPESQQEAKDMVKEAFTLSERLELPVIVRSVTRLSHSSGVVRTGPVERPERELGFNKHWELPFRWNVYGPPGAVEKHAWQLSRMPLVREASRQSAFNAVRRGSRPLGVMAVGMGAAYAREALRDMGLDEQVWLCKVGMAYPLPEAHVLEVLRGCERVLVLEEGEAVVETQARLLAQMHALPVGIIGRCSGPNNGRWVELGVEPAAEPAVQTYGELNARTVRKAIACLTGAETPANPERQRIKEQIQPLVIQRSSTLCAGCPHLGTYWALREALKAAASPAGKKAIPVINGDIGCYEQAGYGVKGQEPAPSPAARKRYHSKSPYDLLDTLYVMGSGISMAQGQARSGAADLQIVAVAGDSTFFHTCMPGLLNAVWNKTRVTFCVMDNAWTAMTGHQVCPATGLTPRGEVAEVVHIEDIARSMGVKSVEVANPYRVEETTAAIRRALECSEAAVVVARAECILQVVRREGKKPTRTRITEACEGCKICIQLGCPAITFLDGKAGIDELLCVDCGICMQICPEGAIVMEDGA